MNPGRPHLIDRFPGWCLAILALLTGARAFGEGVIDSSLPARPTEIEAAIYVIDVVAVDGSMQTFNADVALMVSWHDPRLAMPDVSSRRISLDDIWHPRLLIANVRNSRTTLPELAEVDSEGVVTYRQRVIGDFACPLNLRRFPFDHQQLFIHLVAAGYRPEDVRFVIKQDVVGCAEKLSITDWSLGEPVIEQRSYAIPQSDEEVPGLALSFEVERLARYYGGTIFATVAIITSMAWLVFWLPLAAVNPRISVSVTSMLSLIAYRFVASQDLPRLPYLTRMDFFLLGSTLMVLLGLAGVVLISRKQSHGQEESALRWNRTLRWVYPLVFCLMLLALLW